MSTVRTTGARVAIAAIAAIAAMAVGSCKRESPPHDSSAPSASSASSVSSASSAALPQPPSPRCRVLDGAGLRITLGPRASSPAPTPGADEPEGEDDVALPFAPEIGVGAALDGGFAVSALLPEKGETRAVLAMVGPTLAAGRTLELLKVHGDVSPPRVAAFGKSLIVAIPDGAPNGSLIRLARVDDAADPQQRNAAHVVWGAELDRGSGESEALALEVGTKTALVSWDDWSSASGVEVVKSATFSPSDVKKITGPTVLSSPEEEAEGPLVARRTGGFWVAWMTRAKHRVPAVASAHADEPSPSGVPAAVDTGPRGIALLPLDESGKPIGAPIRVTPEDAHVQGFDLAPADDGGALVAFRDDAAVEGTSGGTMRLVLVRADGSVDARTVTDEDLGPAVPSLLVDGAAVGAVPGWLALMNDSGEARLLALDGKGHALDALSVEANAGTATLLATRGGQILATRPRGKSVEAFVLACEKGRIADAVPRAP